MLAPLLYLVALAAQVTASQAEVRTDVPIEVAREIRLRRASAFPESAWDTQREWLEPGSKIRVERPRLLSVEPGSILDRLGLKSGDVILEMNGHQVVPHYSRPAILPELGPSETRLSIGIRRGGETLTIALDLPAIPEGSAAMVAHAARVAPVTFEPEELASLAAADLPAIAELDGKIIIERAEDGGVAARHALAAGDEVVSIDGTPVARREDVERALARIAAERLDFAGLLLRRDGVLVRHEYRLYWTPPASRIVESRSGNTDVPAAEIAIAEKRRAAAGPDCSFLEVQSDAFGQRQFEVRDLTLGSLHWRLGLVEGDRILLHRRLAVAGGPELDLWIRSPRPIAHLDIIRDGRLRAIVWRTR